MLASISANDDLVERPEMAGVLGLEPSLPELEAGVLAIEHYTPIGWYCVVDSNHIEIGSQPTPCTNSTQRSAPR